MKTIPEDINQEFKEVSKSIDQVSSVLKKLTTDTSIYFWNTEEEVIDKIASETSRIIMHAKQMKFLIRQLRKIQRQP